MAVAIVVAMQSFMTRGLNITCLAHCYCHVIGILPAWDLYYHLRSLVYTTLQLNKIDFIMQYDKK